MGVALKENLQALEEVSSERYDGTNLLRANEFLKDVQDDDGDVVCIDDDMFILDRHLKERYDEFLSEHSEEVSCCGITVNVGELLKEGDEIAYNEMFRNSELDSEEEFDDYLEEEFGEVSVGTLTFDLSRLLKYGANTAYRTGYNDFQDDYVECHLQDASGEMTFWYVEREEADRFASEIDDVIDTVKEYVLDAQGWDEDTNEARLIESADSFKELNHVFTSITSRDELKSQVEDDKQSSVYTELYGDAIDVDSVGQSTPERKRKL